MLDEKPISLMDVANLLRPFHAMPLQVQAYNYMQTKHYKMLSNEPTFDYVDWINSIFYTGQEQQLAENAGKGHYVAKKRIKQPDEIVFAVGDPGQRMAVTVGCGIGIETREKLLHKPAFVTAILDLGVEKPRPVIASAWIFDECHHKETTPFSWNEPEDNSSNNQEFNGKSGNLYTNNPLPDVQHIIEILLEERKTIQKCPNCFGLLTEKRNNTTGNKFWGCNRHPYCNTIDKTRIDATGRKPHRGDEICPECGSSMVIQTAKRGPRAGSKFWGCTAFPACTKTKNYDPNKLKSWSQVGVEMQDPFSPNKWKH